MSQNDDAWLGKDNQDAAKYFDAELASIVSSLSALSKSNTNTNMNNAPLGQQSQAPSIGGFRRNSFTNNSDIHSDILHLNNSSVNDTPPGMHKTAASVGTAPPYYYYSNAGDDSAHADTSGTFPNLNDHSRIHLNQYSASIAGPIYSTGTKGSNSAVGGFFEKFGKSLVEGTKELNNENSHSALSTNNNSSSDLSGMNSPAQSNIQVNEFTPHIWSIANIPVFKPTTDNANQPGKEPNFPPEHDLRYHMLHQPQPSLLNPYLMGQQGGLPPPQYMGNYGYETLGFTQSNAQHLNTTVNNSARENNEEDNNEEADDNDDSTPVPPILPAHSPHNITTPVGIPTGSGPLFYIQQPGYAIDANLDHENIALIDYKDKHDFGPTSNSKQQPNPYLNQRTKVSSQQIQGSQDKMSNSSRTSNDTQKKKKKFSNAGQQDKKTQQSNRQTTSATQAMKGKKLNNSVNPSHHRSPLLEELRLNPNNKNLHLKDVIGHAHEFCKDQHGSRFIQRELNVALPNEREVFFNEIRDEALILANDVFGNYVIQKFFEVGSTTQRNILVENFRGRMQELSTQMYACRVIQKALEYINADQRLELVSELSDCVLSMIKDQNGNHVIQKAIERIPIDDLPFVLDSLKGHIYHLSTHSYGCRVVQRLLEFGSPEDQNKVLQELTDFVPYLIKDQYGNYVIQHILQHGSDPAVCDYMNHLKQDIVKIISENVVEFSKHKFASNVVEKAIIYGTEENKEQLLSKILPKDKEHAAQLEDDAPIILMMRDQFANYVVQKLVGVCDGDNKTMIVICIRSYLAKLNQSTSSGNRHLASVEKLASLVQNVEI